MRISDWSSDVCSSDLERVRDARRVEGRFHAEAVLAQQAAPIVEERARAVVGQPGAEVGQVRAGQHLLDMRAHEKTWPRGFTPIVELIPMREGSWTALSEGRICQGSPRLSRATDRKSVG